jgi:hypothetical protein
MVPLILYTELQKCLSFQSVGFDGYFCVCLCDITGVCHVELEFILITNFIFANLYAIGYIVTLNSFDAT